jgi:hypothetical protein
MSTAAERRKRRVLTIMRRGAVLMQTYTRDGRRWQLCDGTPIPAEVARLLLADRRIAAGDDGLFAGHSQTFRLVP